jgi:trimeric autotransporter adhesin
MYLYNPMGVAVDSSGNVFIADRNNQRVRKVTSKTGIINTVAGNGNPGYSGDNVAATSTTIYYPQTVAVDSSGNIYIADTYNHRIRMVTMTTGIITTVAGTGTASYCCDGAQATDAFLYYPYGVAVDASGNIYIADTSNYRVRFVIKSTGTISTLVGSGTAGSSGDNGPASRASLNNPVGLALDISGNLYIADSGGQKVRMIIASTGYIVTVAGTGIGGPNTGGQSATSANLKAPYSVAVDRFGNMYVAEQGSNQVTLVSGNVTVLQSIYRQPVSTSVSLIL